MLERLAKFGLLGACLFGTAAQAQSGTGASAAQWVVDQSGYHCALAGKLSGEPATAIVLRTLPGTGRFDLSLTADRWPREIRNARREVGVTLVPGGTHFSHAWQVALAENGLISLPNLPPEVLGQFAAASQLEVAVGGRTVLRYSLPRPAAAAEALAGCEAGKLIEAGAAPAGFAPGATRPKPLEDESGWVEIPRMRGLDDEDYAMVRIDVGTDGRATGCGVLEMRGRYNRDRLCNSLLERARYEPARDPSGMTVRSVIVREFRTLVIVKAAP